MSKFVATRHSWKDRYCSRFSTHRNETRREINTCNGVGQRWMLNQLSLRVDNTCNGDGSRKIFNQPSLRDDITCNFAGQRQTLDQFSLREVEKYKRNARSFKPKHAFKILISLLLGILPHRKVSQFRATYRVG
jgi:hypothetical protein